MQEWECKFCKNIKNTFLAFPKWMIALLPIEYYECRYIKYETLIERYNILKMSISEKQLLKLKKRLI